MEPTVRLFRVLANHRRLRILRMLAVLGELRVSELAGATRLHIATVSSHLLALSTCGVVWRRRSGGAVYYRLADAPANPLTLEALSILTQVFRRVRERDPPAVAACDQASSKEYSDAALFKLFTAFTHPRRLQIIRHLAEHDACCQTTLVVELAMSPTALSRHMEKLTRRGIIAMKKSKGVWGYRLLLAGSGVRGRLLRSMVDVLASPKE